MFLNNIFLSRNEKLINLREINRRLELKTRRLEDELKISRDKLKGIAEVLTKTKLGDFLDYLSKIQEDIYILKKMWDALNEPTSFSEEIVLEERIPKKIQIILKKTEKMKKRIEI